MNSNSIVMWETQHSNVDWDYFKILTIAGDLEDSKSTSGGILCIFGSHTFVPTNWMYKKQTSVSRSSTEAEIISLAAILRMDGIPALDLWNLGTQVFHCDQNQPDKNQGSIQGNLVGSRHDKHTEEESNENFNHARQF